MIQEQRLTVSDCQSGKMNEMGKEKNKKQKQKKQLTVSITTLCCSLS